MHQGHVPSDLVESFLPQIRGEGDQQRPSYFMLDGAPLHRSMAVRQYLDEPFPGKWIGRDGPIVWPLRSPDLKPCDFHLWSHVKNCVYQKKSQNLEDLKANTISVFDETPPHHLVDARGVFEERLKQVIALDGSHVEVFPSLLVRNKSHESCLPNGVKFRSLAHSSAEL